MQAPTHLPRTLIVGVNYYDCVGTRLLDLAVAAARLGSDIEFAMCRKRGERTGCGDGLWAGGGGEGLAPLPWDWDRGWVGESSGGEGAACEKKTACGAYKK